LAFDEVAWIALALPLLSLCIVLLVVGLWLQVVLPRGYAWTQFGAVSALFLGAGPFCALTFFAGKSDAWLAGFALSFGLSVFLWGWILTNGALLQSYQRTVACSSRNPPLPVEPPAQRAVQPKMWIGTFGFVREMDRVRWVDLGGRKAVGPITSLEAAALVFMRDAMTRNVMIIVLGISFVGVVSLGHLPLYVMALALAALIGLSLAQRRVVFGAPVRLIDGREYLHLIDEYRPRLIPIPGDLTAIMRFKPGAQSWIAYTSAALGSRVLVMTAPRGGGPEWLATVGLRDWRRLLLWGAVPAAPADTSNKRIERTA